MYLDHTHTHTHTDTHTHTCKHTHANTHTQTHTRRGHCLAALGQHVEDIAQCKDAVDDDVLSAQANTHREGGGFL